MTHPRKAGRTFAAPLAAAILLWPGTGTSPAAAQDGSSRALPVVVAEARDALYQEGMKALDERRWMDAVHAFHQVVDRGGPKADAALYWIAYSFKQMGRPGAALEVLDRLYRGHPDSRWIRDAKALDIEVRDDMNAPVPDPEHLECELKLVATQAIARREPQNAASLLKRFLDMNCPAESKAAAIMLLVDSGASGARETLADLARRSTEPQVRAAAIQGLAMLEDGESLKLVREMYAGSPDADLKRQLLQAARIREDREWLLQVVREEQSSELRGEAIQLLGSMGEVEDLQRLYEREPSPEIEWALLHAFLFAGNKERILAMASDARSERAREEAIHLLGVLGATDELRQIASTNRSPQVKRAIMHSFLNKGDAAGLIEMARAEKDPDLRKEAIYLLSLMDSEEAARFLKEILEE